MLFQPPYLLFIGDCDDTLAAKTALGLLQWRRECCLGYYSLPGCSVTLDLPELTPQQAQQQGAKTLVVGVAAVGGKLSPRWLPTLEQAAGLGMDIVSGLHDHLTAQPSLVAYAQQSGARLVDVRKVTIPLVMATGVARSGKRLLTVGSDLCVGKKFTALALEQEMRARQLKATFRATGQTGIMIAGRGIPLDAVPGDFICGAVEQLTPPNEADHWDLIEGQGTLLSPIACTSLGLLNGAQADALVLCHDPTRRYYRAAPHVPLASLEETMAMNLMFARRHRPNVAFCGISLNTAGLSPARAAALKARWSAQFNLPVVDPLRDGVGAIVDRLIALFPEPNAATALVPSAGRSTSFPGWPMAPTMAGSSG